MFTENWEQDSGPVRSKGSGRAAGSFSGVIQSTELHPLSKIQTHYKQHKLMPSAAASLALQGITGRD